MKIDLNPQIKAKLIARFGMKELSANGVNYLQQGRCPNCEKKSVWTWADNPGNIQCNRQSKCGYSETTKNLFPELYENLSKNYAPTQQDPHKTATAYLSLMRGFDPAQLKGFYRQAEYRNPNANKTTQTVKFWLDEANGIGWEKFIDKVLITDPDDGSTSERDSRAIGQFKGKCWVPPTQPEPKIGQQIYITEGIFDAIALMLSGKFVCAQLTSGNFPKEYIEKYAGMGISWIYALDPDAAGRKCSLKHIKMTQKMGEKSRACMPAEDSNKVDWNDLYKLGQLTKAHFDEYDYFGGLLTAVSAEDKAKLIYNRTERSLFTFEHRSQLYGFNLKLDQFTKEFARLKEAKEESSDGAGLLSKEEIQEIRAEALDNSNSLNNIANCVPSFLYSQMNPITEELFYLFRIKFPDGRNVKSTMTGAQLAGAADFRKRMLSMGAGAIFKGKAEHHEYMLDQWMRDVQEVDTVAYAGYVPEHEAFVYKNFAAKNGQIVKKNSEDYCAFEKLNIKSTYHNVELTVNHELGQYKEDWFNNLATAWGDKGIIALAFWLGSLFVNQIREKDKTFPFLEVVGEPGTGKTTLIEFLWKLFGRFDYEGIDPSSSNAAAIARSMNQVSGLPVVLMEGDRQSRANAKQAGFQWAETKKLYNGRSMKSRGMRTQGNETYEPPFRGSLVITQNAPVDAEQAVLERICHTFMKKSECNAETLVASRALGNTPIEDVSGFLLKALQNEGKILEMYFKRQPVYEKAINDDPKSRTPRLALNHSQLMGLIDALTLITPITKEQRVSAVQTLNEMVYEREAAIKREHPDVEWFFEVCQTVMNRNVPLNHKKDDSNHVALRMAEVYSAAANHQLRLPEVNDMKKLLRNSRRFVDYKSVNSGITGGTAKCWVFNMFGEVA